MSPCCWIAFTTFFLKLHHLHFVPFVDIPSVRSLHANGQAFLELQGRKLGTNPRARGQTGLTATCSQCLLPVIRLWTMQEDQDWPFASAVHLPGSLPEVDRSHIFTFFTFILEGKKYQGIFVHFTRPLLISASSFLSLFTVWCYNYLNQSKSRMKTAQRPYYCKARMLNISRAYLWIIRTWISLNFKGRNPTCWDPKRWLQQSTQTFQEQH